MAISKNKASNKTQETTATTYDVKVTRAKKFENGGIVFDLLVNGVAIYNCNYKEYNGKSFTSFPARKGSDNKYYSHAYFKITDEMQADIERQIEEKI